MRESKALQHLDISNMLLGDMILEFSESIRLSTGLLSVHIGGNELSEDTLQKFLV